MMRSVLDVFLHEGSDGSRTFRLRLLTGSAAGVLLVLGVLLKDPLLDLQTRVSSYLKPSLSIPSSRNGLPAIVDLPK